MKKVVLFFAVVASVAIFGSCGPKQGNSAPNQDSIVNVVDSAAINAVDSAAQVVDSAAQKLAQ